MSGSEQQSSTADNIELRDDDIRNDDYDDDAAARPSPNSDVADDDFDPYSRLVLSRDCRSAVWFKNPSICDWAIVQERTNSVSEHNAVKRLLVLHSRSCSRQRQSDSETPSCSRKRCHFALSSDFLSVFAPAPYRAASFRDVDVLQDWSRGEEDQLNGALITSLNGLGCSCARHST